MKEHYEGCKKAREEFLEQMKNYKTFSEEETQENIEAFGEMVDEEVCIVSQMAMTGELPREEAIPLLIEFSERMDTLLQRYDKR